MSAFSLLEGKVSPTMPTQPASPMTPVAASPDDAPGSGKSSASRSGGMGKARATIASQHAAEQQVGQALQARIEARLDDAIGQAGARRSSGGGRPRSPLAQTPRSQQLLPTPRSQLRLVVSENEALAESLSLRDFEMEEMGIQMELLQQQAAQ